MAHGHKSSHLRIGTSASLIFFFKLQVFFSSKYNIRVGRKHVEEIKSKNIIKVREENQCL